MVVFRVDSNSMIGHVHMYRCVAIAKALKMMGKQVMFVCREDSDVSRLQQSFIEYRLVPSQRLGSEEAIRILKDILCELQANVCVVDSCDIDNKGFESLKEKCRVVYIEDYMYEVFNVDCIINPNLYASKFNYLEKYTKETEILLGLEYSPFNIEEMVPLASKTKREVNTILLFVGDTDKYELAPGIIDSLLDCVDDNTRIKVITTKNSSTKDRLFQMSNYSSQIVVEQDVTNYSKLFRSADLAVFAGENICYDLLRFNIPSCIFVNDNSQKMLQTSFVEENLAVYGGNYIENKNKFYGELVKGVSKLLEDDIRKNITDNINKLDIGRGAENVARAILKYE